MTPVNDAPVVTATSYTVAEDALLVVPAPGLLANATDGENDPLVASLVSGPGSGTVNVHPDGSFVYQASANYAGPASFTYRAEDAFGAGINVGVSTSVTAVNDPPTVTFTSPANGASIAVGVGINLAVSTADIDGTVVGVGYYNGAHLVASSGTPPFSVTWTNPGPGAYTLTARATDNSGAMATSLPVTFTVSGDCDGDGVSDAVEIAQGTDPCDVFNGAMPLLSIVSGNYQTGPANGVLPQLLKVRVSNAAGVPASGAPVAFAPVRVIGQVFFLSKSIVPKIPAGA